MASKIDPDLLVELPCEFCGVLFPLIQFVGHQGDCRRNPFRTIHDRFEEIIDQRLYDLEDIPENRTKRNENRDILYENLIELAADPPIPKHVDLSKETSSKNKTENVKRNRGEEYDEDEVIKDEFLQESEFDFTLGSKSNRGKSVEEEKPSYKISPIPILKDSEIKYPIHNDLPDSDNEEGENLEDFWKKADVLLAQKLREIEKRS